MNIERLSLFSTEVVVVEDFLDDAELTEFHSVMDPLPTVGDQNATVRLIENFEELIDTQPKFFYDKVTTLVRDQYKMNIKVGESVYNHMNYNEDIHSHHHLDFVHGADRLKTVCVLAACYYTNTGEGFAKLKFNNPQPMAQLFGGQPAVKMEPKPNSLILFPSWAQHGTTVHGSKKTRKTLVLELFLD